jgi:hypothetical protein
LTAVFFFVAPATSRRVRSERIAKTKTPAAWRGTELKANKPVRMNEYELPENNIPEDIHQRAREIAKALFHTPPKRQKDIRKNFSKNRDSH